MAGSMGYIILNPSKNMMDWSFNMSQLSMPFQAISHALPAVSWVQSGRKTSNKNLNIKSRKVMEPKLVQETSRLIYTNWSNANKNTQILGFSLRTRSRNRSTPIFWTSQLVPPVTGAWSAWHCAIWTWSCQQFWILKLNILRMTFKFSNAVFASFSTCFF